MADLVLASRMLERAVQQGVDSTLIQALGVLARPELLRAPSLRLLRPEDLVVLDVKLLNLKREGGRIVRSDPAKRARMIVSHQFQAVAELALLDTGNQDKQAGSEDEDLNPQGAEASGTENPPALFQSGAAGPSRLVFEMPAGEDWIEDSLQAVLDACRRWPLVLSPLAEPDNDRLGWTLPDLKASLDVVREILGRRFSTAAARRLRAGAKALATELLDARRHPSGMQKRVLVARLDALAADTLGPLTRMPAAERGAAQVLARIEVAQAVLPEARRIPEAVAVLHPDILPILRTPRPPGGEETALEVPCRLMATPLPGAGFAHAVTAVTREGRTELWHSRLGTRREGPDGVSVDDRPGEAVRGGWRGEKMRFLWSPDYKDASPAQYRQPLDRLDRQMLVKLTAGYNETRPGRLRYTPRAFHLRRLMLTSLGGDLEAERRWDLRPEDVDLVAWVHRAALARDYFVRVEYAGFLYPLGHRAVLVKLTERRFEWRDRKAKQDRIAPLRQRFFIIVRERMVAYPQASPMPHGGRRMPFQEIHCLVEQTPTLADPGAQAANRLADDFYPNGQVEYRRAFWPALGNGSELYRFPFAGRDGAGRLVRFELPVMFVSEVYNKSSMLGPIRSHYNWLLRKSRRSTGTGGQTVRLAPARPDAGDVDLSTSQLVMWAENPTTGVSAIQGTQLQAFPAMQEATVRLETIERVTGVRRDPVIRYDSAYLASGFVGGNGELFARMIAPEALAFGSGSPTSSVGGIATPDLTPSGLSARHGVASGDLGQFATGTFNPVDFLPDAKLLGFFSLKDLLKPLPLTSPAGLPEITTRESASEIETRFRLVQPLDPGEKLPGLVTGAGGQTHFTLDSRLVQPKSGAAPRRDVEGTLTNFKINLAGVMILRFDRLRFLSVDGRKPDVDVDLHPQHGVTFGGPLEFINRLKDFIPSNGFSDPPDISVTPQGITAGYQLGLPNVQVGILSLTNISLGASFTLPFTGQPPAARFNFAERHNTFNLTVSMFGGGGFVALVVGAEGVREIEAALEFGARISIDLGVASGSVYVKGGFYFHWGQTTLVFEGYVELGGRLSVLGLITASLTFHLSLAYQKLSKGANGKALTELRGQATLVVEVEVLLFSASVSVRVERRFKGAEADPLFIDFVPTQELWDEYCDAFA
jgi:hypothetical protein